jgi:membrane-bound inhibitor of C-type lysozyme
MNIRSSAFAAFLAITVLTGCTSTPTDHATPDAASTWTSYTCSDGQVVQASYPDTNTAMVKIKGETHTLRVAISGSGARYVSDDWQWWTKGMHDGTLAPLAPGETIASTPGVTCHAG